MSTQSPTTSRTYTATMAIGGAHRGWVVRVVDRELSLSMLLQDRDGPMRFGTRAAAEDEAAYQTRCRAKAEKLGYDPRYD